MCWFYDQRGGGRGPDHHVHFDEDEARDEYDEGFDDNENLFAHHGHFGQPHVHRCGAGHDGENHHGRRLIAKEMIQKAMLALS